MTQAWIVIPTYNEAENLPGIVAAVRAAMPTAVSGVAASILVVDDNSPDGTGDIADGLVAAHPDVHVLHRAGKAGLAAAYVAGFGRALAAGADYVLEMDADFSHEPADLPRLLEAARAGADVVIGSRYVRGGGVDGWSRDRQLLSRLGGFYARAVLGSRSATSPAASSASGPRPCARSDSRTSRPKASPSRLRPPTGPGVRVCASWRCRSSSTSAGPAARRCRRRSPSRRSGASRSCASPPGAAVSRPLRRCPRCPRTRLRAPDPRDYPSDAPAGAADVPCMTPATRRLLE